MRREKINLTNDFIGKPFKGLRSAKGSADKLIAPPYDVVSREQVAEMKIQRTAYCSDIL